MSDNNKIMQPKPDEVAQIAAISMKVRQAIRAALPAPAEQFFTVMVPGKVLNFEDYTGGIGPDGKATTVLKPNSVQLAEAILCDDMPALSTVQLGPTGRSVSRSYGATLSKLCPAGSTTGVDEGESEVNMNEQSKRYKKAMNWLTGVDPETPGKKRVELYREKQSEYTDAFEKKVKAFNEALDLTTKDPRNKSVEEQRQAYDKWVSENHKTYRNMCQAAYMDWVTVGKKEETEYWFSIVDNDSAMSRVESSKEAMRNAIISDTDGSAEYQKVKLEPSNWAWLAKQKSTSPAGIENLRWSKSRLQKINEVIRAMLGPKAQQSEAGKAKEGESSSTATGTATSTSSSNEGESAGSTGYAKALKVYREKDTEYKADKAKNPSADPNIVTEAKQALDAARESLASARKKLTEELQAKENDNVAALNDKSSSALDTMLNARESDLEYQLQTNTKLIDEYDRQIAEFSGGEVNAIQKAIADETGIGSVSNPVGGTGKAVPDYWTSISVEVSSKKVKEEQSQSANSYSASASGRFGLWSVGGSASHSDSTADAMKEMANSDVKISFDCMRVDINRSWLRPELFYDHDLKPAPGLSNYISPGPVTLAGLLDPASYETSSEVAALASKKEEVLSRYDLFPMYPTAFLLAANVVLEITTETSTIKNHFSEKSTSGSGSVGYGPFCVSASASHSDKQISSNCETTANGVRITVKSPQIIGWISQMLPALPRPESQFS